MTTPEQTRVAEWITDAFAIVSTRLAATSPGERNIRLGFEAILRQFGPLPAPAGAWTQEGMGPPPGASHADLLQVAKALDSCLAVFARHDESLTSAERRIQILVRATRRYTGEELRAREMSCTT